MTDLDLDRIRRLVPERHGTHHAGCEVDHVACALVALADEVERRRADDELRPLVWWLVGEVAQLGNVVVAMLGASTQKTRAAVAAALEETG